MHERDARYGSGLDSQLGSQGDGAGKTTRTQWVPAPVLAPIQRKAADGGGEPAATAFEPCLGVDLTGQGDAGFAVPSPMAARVAEVTGGDTSGVRLHTGEASAAAAASLGARAYTIGQDVHFGAGEYAPGDREGDALIAHELVHTLQQSGSASPSAQCKLEVSEPGDAAELEADALAQRIIEPASASASSGGRTAPATPVAATISRRISRVPIKVKIADTRPPGQQSPAKKPDGIVDPWPDSPSPQQQQQPKSPDANGIVDPWGPQHGEDQWGANVNPAYRGRAKTPAPEGSYINTVNKAVTVESYRAGLPPIEAISAKIKGPMREVTYDITTADIEYIVGPALHEAAKGHEKDFQTFVENMVRAFSVCGIDTIEGQAVFLAHATGETGFAYPTEGQKKYDGPGKPGDPFQMDPDQAKIDGGDAGPRRYMKDHNWSIDPHNHIPKHDPALPGRAAVDASTFENTFIGRGPVQVTHHYNYVQTLVVMEQMAKTANGADADLLWRAIGAIKKDPSEAANPEYTFLFSAAYMQMSGGTNAAARLPGQKPNFYGQDDASSWVAGGGKDVREYGEEFGKAADRKAAAYGRAMERLGDKAKAAAAAEDGGGAAEAAQAPAQAPSE